MQHFQRLFERLYNLSESSTSLSNMLWFAESVKNALVFVDPLVEFSLQFVLGHADKEVSNQLWNRFAHRPDSDLENGVDTRSNFFYKDVCASSVRLLCRRLLLLLRD